APATEEVADADATGQASGGTDVILFDPTAIQIDPDREPIPVASCEPSQVVPTAGVYQCSTSEGGHFDPCWVVDDGILLCEPSWNAPSFDEPTYILAAIAEPLPVVDPASTGADPVVFYVILEEGNPPCAKRADLEMELDGQPVTYSCAAPGAWLVGDLETSQPTWIAQRVITDSSGTTVTDGPTPVAVVQAWAY
ncbi:MAG: hypothetical protein HC802_00885, partial [Caldilineaceae bacterium]|nr:hypothetical protein [Caldilineaceae bacterium]